MPKKFVGENSKAVIARARKNDAKTQQDALKKQQKEDEDWKDDHKQTIKKQQKLVCFFLIFKIFTLIIYILI